MSARLSPVARKVIVHCRETGGLLPEDNFPVSRSTLNRMVGRGLLFRESIAEDVAWFLTDEGKKIYPWPETTA